MVIYSKELYELVMICYDYWPANKVCEELHLECEAIYRSVLIMLRSYRWLAMVTCSMIVPLQPLITGKKIPVEMWQPVDLSQTPLLQITFIVQCIASYFAVFVNVGFDSLFVAIMTYTICQFQICGRAFRKLDLKSIKTENDEKDLWNKIKEYIQYHDYLIE